MRGWGVFLICVDVKIDGFLWSVVVKLGVRGIGGYLHLNFFLGGWLVYFSETYFSEERGKRERRKRKEKKEKKRKEKREKEKQT